MKSRQANEAAIQRALERERMVLEPIAMALYAEYEESAQVLAGPPPYAPTVPWGQLSASRQGGWMAAARVVRNVARIAAQGRRTR